MPRSLRIAIVGAAWLLASHATPASAQQATFTEIRDAVPFRHFDSQTTATQPGAPNTLVIGLHGADPFKASARVDSFTGTPLATDTLSVVVNAPAGHVISSITCELAGHGAVNTPGDARVSANWVVNGQPASLGSFGGAQFPNAGAEWSSTQTIAFSDPTLTSVPVSLTAQLFAFAASALASAEVEITTATIVVTLGSSTTASQRD
jgi:hypothetical protein